MYLALVAVNQYRIVRGVENYSEYFEKRVYRDDTGRALVCRYQDTKMLNAVLFHVCKAFFTVRRLYQSAGHDQNHFDPSANLLTESTSVPMN